MVKVRRLLVPVVAAWLVVHVSVASGAAVFLLAAAGSPTPDIVCTCTHGADHGACPMHQTSKGSARCRMQGVEDDLGLALMSMLGPLTLPSTAVDARAVLSAPVPKGYDSTLPSDWTVPPDAPPPRG